MTNNTLRKAKLTAVAQFPAAYFLENIAIRRDNSMLITVANKQELWFVPSLSEAGPVEPLKLHTFDVAPSGIVEAEPDVFYISAGKFYNTDEGFLQRLELRDWTAGAPQLRTVHASSWQEILLLKN